MEILRTSMAILLVLILIFISGRFIKYIQFAVEGSISSSTVFSLLALQIPAVAGFLLPLSFFIAILLTFGRLHVENEMAVIHGVGISELQLAKNIMPLAILFALIASVLSFWVTPWSGYQSKELMVKDKMGVSFGAFSAGAFRENKSKSGVVFVESTDGNEQIKGLFAVSGLNDPNAQLEIQVAQSARLWQAKSSETETSRTDNKDSTSDQKQEYLVLEKGNSYRYDPKSKSWQVTQYEAYFMQIEEPEQQTINLKVKAIASNLLFKRGEPADWAELHWRLSAPLSIPILCLLAIPLARTPPRKGKFSRLFPAISVYMIYALLMMNGRGLLEKEKIPVELGFWWIHGIAVIFAGWLYRPKKKKSTIKLRSAHG